MLQSLPRETRSTLVDPAPRIDPAAASKAVAERAADPDAAVSLDEILSGCEALPNPIDRSMVILRARVIEAIRGQIALVYVSGPPGIGKSSVVVDQLTAYSHAVKQKWKARNLSEKLEDDRRTRVIEATGLVEFVEPWVRILGRSTLNRFFALMYRASGHGEGFFH